MAALTSAQRGTLRSMFEQFIVGTGGAFTSGGAISPTEWANRQLSQLDEYRSTPSRRWHYEARMRPFLVDRVKLSSTWQARVDTHARGQ